MFLLHACFFDPKTLPVLLNATVKGYQMGEDCKSLFAEKFEEKWSINLDDYRRDLNIIPYKLLT